MESEAKSGRPVRNIKRVVYNDTIKKSDKNEDEVPKKTSKATKKKDDDSVPALKKSKTTTKAELSKDSKLNENSTAPTKKVPEKVEKKQKKKTTTEVTKEMNENAMDASNGVGKENLKISKSKKPVKESKKGDSNHEEIEPKKSAGKGSKSKKPVEEVKDPLAMEENEPDHGTSKDSKAKKTKSAAPKATSKDKKTKANVEKGNENNVKLKSTVENDETEINNEVAPVKSGNRKKKLNDIIDVAQPTTKTKKTAAKSTISKKTKGDQVQTSSAISQHHKRKIVKSEDDEIIPVKQPKVTKLNKTSTDYQNTNFDLPSSKTWNLKISSWNVAGLRAVVEKGGMEFIERENPDIFCIQETKCMESDLPISCKVKGYHNYWLAKTGGRAGVGLYTKIMPYNVEYGIQDEEMDDEGRIITAEYTKFFLLCVYVPNAGRKLVTLPKRLRWDKLFQEYVNKLNERKPVIICGDMNVAHEEIDLANPKTNKKSAGFTIEEREGMTKMLNFGFVDTFRMLYPKKNGVYTYWTYMANARAKNVGWRLDYFIVSERIANKVVDNVIRSEVMGSDHCPITLFLNF